ncbi:hypothetical protein DIPPA_23325 [Diplonema papillatum]|nr:hypothetical protein DIPPA_23325 [Diplonema papillatum]
MAKKLLLLGGDVETNPGPRSLTIATLNPTSLLGYLPAVASIPADVVCCQEVSLLEAKRPEAELHLEAWKCHWGAEPLGRKCRSSGIRSETSATNGGVCTLVRKPVPAYSPATLHGMTGAAFADARLLHTAVATGKGSTFVHVLNVYCPSGNGRAECDRREALLESVLFAAADSLGDVPIVVIGDLNTDEERSPVLRKALRNGWTDSAQLHEANTGTPPDPTFTTTGTMGTRIDRILLNRVSALAFASCKTTVVNVPGHRLVSVTLDLEAFDQRVLRYRLPRPIPVGPQQQRDASQEGLAAARRLLDESRLAQDIADGDVDAAWREWAGAAEAFLLDSCNVQASERLRFTGRGQPRDPIRARATARSAADGTGAASGLQLRLRNAIHRLEQIQRYLARPAGPGACTVHIRNCWQNCRRLARECAALQDIPVAAYANLPTAQECGTLLRAVRDRNNRLGREGMAARHGKYVREAVNRADTDRRGLAAWCRRQPRREATTLRTDRVTANVDEMDAVLQSAWDPIFRSYKEQPEPLYNLFADRFKSYIHRQPMEVEEITGADLRALLMKKSAKGACGVDGWRMAELKALPDPMLDALAELLNLVERTGEWPRALQTALVTMTPKGDDNDPVKMRPITVTSCVYRLWACRRLKDIVTWQEGWIEDGQHGFRPGHRGEDPLMTMAMEIEYALLSGDPLYGLSLDFSKCFDRVPHELTMRLMQELGLHERIMTPLRGIYGVLVRRFKLPLGVGDEFEVTNGILQGCPISVILINALLSIPMKAVKAEAPGLLTESYADDANLMTRISEAALQKGVDVVDEFCRLTGMALNMDKTFVFTTVRDYVSRLQLRSTGRKFPQATALKCLGAKLSTSRKGRDHNDTARLETATSTAHNLRHVPIPQPSRVLLVQSAILPAALARVPFAPTTKESVEKLTTGVMSAVWGTKNPKRAPEAVLGILEKAHLTDPATRMAYSITGQFYTACQRLPHLVPQAAKIREMYGPRVTAALGPVGIAVKYGLEPCGHDWAGGPLDDVKRNGEPYLPLGKSPAERNHDIRSDLKTRLRARLVARRGSYADVDLDATNALWKSRACPPQTARLIRVAIA